MVRLIAASVVVVASLLRLAAGSSPLTNLPSYFYPYCDEVNGICQVACRACQNEKTGTSFGKCIKRWGVPRCEFRTWHHVTVGGGSTQCVHPVNRTMSLSFNSPYPIYRTPYGVVRNAWLRVELGSLPPYCQVAGNYWNPGRMAVLLGKSAQAEEGDCEPSEEIVESMFDVQIYAGNHSYLYVSLYNSSDLMWMMQRAANHDSYESAGLSPFTIWLDPGDCGWTTMKRNNTESVIIAPFRWAMRRYADQSNLEGAVPTMWRTALLLASISIMILLT